MNTTTNESGFYGLGIAPKLLSILDSRGFTVPTPIQQKSIPVALLSKDIIGIAQTGTGKTLAFGIPLIQRLAVLKGLGLVVLPTRELAMQVADSLQIIGKPLGLKTAILIGGESMGRQISQLKHKPHCIIATPGRLIDHLEQKTVNLSTVSALVLDEADRMLDMGFMPQIKKLLEHLPKERQTMLFSATMPPEISDIATKFMKLPVRVEVAPSGTTSKQISHELFFVSKNQKLDLLGQLLNEYKGSVLVFTRTKFGAKKIAQVLKKNSVSATEIHSNRSLAQRLEALNGFKVGKYRVLVATDIAARGIDVRGIELVVNYDLPENPDDYVHRIGRTGRAERTGHAVSFATPDQKRDVSQIEKITRSKLPVSKLPTLAKMDHQVQDEDIARNESSRGRSSFRRFDREGGSRFGGSGRGGRGERSSADRAGHAERGERSERTGFKQKFERNRRFAKPETGGKKGGFVRGAGARVMEDKESSTVEMPGLMFRFGSESVSTSRMSTQPRRDNRRFSKKRGK